MNPRNTDLSKRVTRIAQLDALYGEPVPAALVKEIDHLSQHYQSFIEHSPFLVMATASPEGLDCSPRGDAPGFVKILDDKTLLLPDRRGNNRIDTLRNLVIDPRISLLFLIPGVGETLRVKGTADILTDSDLCQSFSMNGKAPVTVLLVSVQRVYFQCQKALVRSKLWNPASQISRATLPSTGEILEALSQEPFDGRQYDEDYPERLKKTLY